MTHYIQSYYDGTLYEYSKEPKEGFVEHTNSKGKVTYRRYYNQGVEGVLKGVEKRANQYLNNREEIIFTLENSGDDYKISFPVLSNDGTQLDDFSESIVRVLPNLTKGELYNINNWRMNKGDTLNDGSVVEFSKSGVTFKKGGEKVKPALSYQTEDNPNGDIPRVEWKELAGKNRPTASSKEKKLEFLYSTLLEQVDRLSNTQGQNQNKQSSVETNKVADADDLPF